MSTMSELSTRISKLGEQDARAYVAMYGFSAAANRFASLKDGAVKDGWRKVLQSLA